MYRKAIVALVDGVALRVLAISLTYLGVRLDAHLQQCSDWTLAHDGSIVCSQYVPTHNFADRIQVLSVALTVLSYVLVVAGQFVPPTRPPRVKNAPSSWRGVFHFQRLFCVQFDQLINRFFGNQSIRNLALRLRLVKPLRHLGVISVLLLICVDVPRQLVGGRLDL